MNDLSKKKERRIEETKASKKEGSGSNGLLQKKLENFLLLFYQGYLKGETTVDSEIRSAFLSLVKQDEELAFKARMMQLDYLKLENLELEGRWNEATEELFPDIDFLEKPIDESRKR